MVHVTEVVVSPKEHVTNQDKGQHSVRLTARVYPSNATNKRVKWTSSNEQVAKVNSSGVVTFVLIKTNDRYNKHYINAGEAIITATSEDGGKTGTCSIIVQAIVN